MLDRIVGFKLSGLLKSKIKVQSAGRVQSAVLKLIIDKENEIKAFVPVEYWTMKAETSAQNQDFTVNFKRSLNLVKLQLILRRKKTQFLQV